MQLRLKEFRKKRGMNQSELAEAIGTTMRVVSSWERLETPIPLVDAAKIADLFDCTLDELAGRDFVATAPYADPRQAELNRCWARLDTERQNRLVGTAIDMEAAKSLRTAAVQPEERVS